jgi:glycosyltransferase involved in cell wall biosynthesis
MTKQQAKTKKRIGIDCRCMSINGGVKTYALNLINNLIQLDKENEYFLFYNDKKLLNTFSSANFHEVCVNFNIPSLYFIWDQIIISFLTWFYRIDVIHGLKNTIPIFVRAKRIVTIHDVIPILYPKTMKYTHALYWKFVFYVVSKIKSQIIFDSNCTQDDFYRLFKTKNQSSVIYLGVNLSRNINTNYCIKNRRQQILYVGSLEKRKNLPRLIRAFGDVHKRFTDFKLILVGKQGVEDKEINNVINELGLSEFIEKKGFVSNDDLDRYYNESQIFVYVSEYEGFGLPILEAMGHGLPVVTSKTSSLGEIAGDSAFLVDPDNFNDIRDGIIKLIDSQSISAVLVENGYQNISRFSWKECAKNTYEKYII